MQSFKFHFICPFHDFSAQLPYSSHSFPPPPLSPCAVHIPCHQITEPNKIILIYMQDEQQRQRRLSPGAAARPPAQAESPFFFLFSVLLSTVNRFGRPQVVAQGEVWGVDRPTKCFDSAWTRLQLLSTKRADDDERRI